MWKLREYLEGYHFTVFTDHQSLKWLQKTDNPSGRLDRWAIELNQWDFDVHYRRGSENHIADALSCQLLHFCTVTTKDYQSWYKNTLGTFPYIA